ncbi:MAG: hypothetical protein MUC99_12510 [Anaerolineae bacterium]|jgi:hypothetical protein|nr:hypothetical protein [Anaerolineae bacterium]
MKSKTNLVSFVSGIARLADFGGALKSHTPRTSRFHQRSDREALQSDWGKISQDFQKAITRFEKLKSSGNASHV